MVVTEFQAHEQLPKEVLVWVLVDAVNYLGEHPAKALQLCFFVLSGQGNISFLSALDVAFVYSVGNADGNHDHKICPYSPAIVPPTRLVKNADEFFLLVIPQLSGYVPGHYGPSQ